MLGRSKLSYIIERQEHMIIWRRGVPDVSSQAERLLGEVEGMHTHNLLLLLLLHPMHHA
jgi:hypothetical protein